MIISRISIHLLSSVILYYSCISNTACTCLQFITGLTSRDSLRVLNQPKHACFGFSPYGSFTGLKFFNLLFSVIQLHVQQHKLIDLLCYYN